MRHLVTGGAGYVGTHLVLALLEAGHDVVVIDDFSSGHPRALARAEALAGRRCTLIRGDVADQSLTRAALEGVDTVFHLAAYKMVGESMEKPERYLLNNIGGMAALIAAMEDVGVRRIVYSSTAAVYGTGHLDPIREDAPTAPESPYGHSKAEGERMLDWMTRLRGWSAVSLRYFNPVGAHPSGRIGEPLKQAMSLVPRALMALTGAGPELTVFGTDYDTPDGTCLRDYIHVWDLARAHLFALQALEEPGHHLFNVGTGRPHSVREVLAACAQAAGRPVPHADGARRAGDLPIAVADPSRFLLGHGFEATLGLDVMVASALRWCLDNPDGYGPQPLWGLGAGGALTA